MKMVFAVMNTTNERNSEIQACTGFLACDHCDTDSVPYQLSHCYDGGS